MSLSLVIAFALGILSGVVTALRVIAPKTKTTLDDKALKVGEEVLDAAEKIGFKSEN